MSEQEVTSASPTSDTSATPTESALVAEKPKAPTKEQLIAQRKLRKQIQAQQKHLRAPMTRAEVYGFLQQIDKGLQKMDATLAQCHNAIAFLIEKGVFTQEEYDVWDKATKERLKAEAEAKKNAAPVDGTVADE